MAELVDALDLESSAYGVGVQLPPLAPEKIIPDFIGGRHFQAAFLGKKYKRCPNICTNGRQCCRNADCRCNITYGSVYVRMPNINLEFCDILQAFIQLSLNLGIILKGIPTSVFSTFKDRYRCKEVMRHQMGITHGCLNGFVTHPSLDMG